MVDETLVMGELDPAPATLVTFHSLVTVDMILIVCTPHESLVTLGAPRRVVAKCLFYADLGARLFL